MTQRTIDLGTQGGADGTGDTIRTAGVKINDNFSEVYEFAPVKSDIRFQGNNIVTLSTNANIDISAAGTGSINLKDFKINDNNIETTNTNGDLRIVPSGTGYVMIDGLGFSGTSIHASDSSSVNINENLIVAGTLNADAPTFDAAVTVESTLDVTSATTLSSLTVSGASSFVGTTTIDNLTFNDNIITTSSNADLLLTPGGTGVVNVSNLTIDSSVNLTDNVIKLTRSNDDLILSAASSGSVVISKIDMNEGTVDNTVIGATTPAAGSFTTLVFSPTNTGSLSTTGLTITDNTITSTQSNADVELDTNATGKVAVNGIKIPNTDGTVGQVLKTDGNGTLSFLAHSSLYDYSFIDDASATVLGNSSAAQVIDSFAVATYRSAKYHIQTSDTTADRYRLIDINVTHDGTNAYISVFGGVDNGTGDGSTVYDSLEFTADVSGGNVRLLGTVNNTNNQVIKLVRRVIKV